MGLLEATQAVGKADSLEWKWRSPLLPGWQVAILPPLRGWPAGTSRIFLERRPHILDRGQVSGAWQIFTAGLPHHSRTTEKT